MFLSSFWMWVLIACLKFINRSGELIRFSLVWDWKLDILYGFVRIFGLYIFYNSSPLLICPFLLGFGVCFLTNI